MAHAFSQRLPPCRRHRAAACRLQQTPRWSPVDPAFSRCGAPSTRRGASAAARSESSSGIACAIVLCSSDYMYHVRACCACACGLCGGDESQYPEARG